MSIEENSRSLANVEARVADEKQDHKYNEDESKGHIQGEYVHQGEDVKRTEKASKATAGRHVTSGKDGLAIARERKSHNEKSREEHQKSWDSDKKSVVPERKK